LVDFSVSGCGIYITQQSDIDVGWKIKVDSVLSEHLDSELVYKVVSKKNKGKVSCWVFNSLNTYI